LQTAMLLNFIPATRLPVTRTLLDASRSSALPVVRHHLFLVTVSDRICSVHGVGVCKVQWEVGVVVE